MIPKFWYMLTDKGTADALVATVQWSVNSAEESELVVDGDFNTAFMLAEARLLVTVRETMEDDIKRLEAVLAKRCAVLAALPVVETEGP